MKTILSRLAVFIFMIHRVGMAQMQVYNSNGARVMTATQDGKIAIGDVLPSATLHVLGSVRLQNLPSSSVNTLQLSLDADGNVAQSPVTDLDVKVKGTATDATPGYLLDKVNHSMVVAVEKVQLSSDEAAPGAFEHYGTDVGGSKGFYPIGGVFRGLIAPDGLTAPGYVDVTAAGTSAYLPEVLITVPVTGVYLIHGNYNMAVINDRSVVVSPIMGGAVDVEREGVTIATICDTRYSLYMVEFDNDESFHVQKDRYYIYNLQAGDILKAKITKYSGAASAIVRGYVRWSAIILTLLVQ